MSAFEIDDPGQIVRGVLRMRDDFNAAHCLIPSQPNQVFFDAVARLLALGQDDFAFVLLMVDAVWSFRDPHEIAHLLATLESCNSCSRVLLEVAQREARLN